MGVLIGGTLLGAQVTDELQQRMKLHATERNIIPQSVVEALKKGNQLALQTIYIHLKNPLEHFLYTLLKNKEEAQDIVQETFITLWENRESLDVKRNVRSLIYTIARNKVINLFNRNQVGKQYIADASLATGEAGTTSEEELIAQETQLLIDLVVNRMPKMRREIFRLSHYQGLSNDEISLYLNIPKENVANHISRAKKELKKVLF
ncbi:MAG: sigma-70 family RNA polymerase sigma factor [Mediterranea sp.]|jgi:RNA polymerase sigma-70 factor (ECF subfamily)|nr:sigma-70 family RNA polymerase sigma factor [Mediterranea sp.]